MKPDYKYQALFDADNRSADIKELRAIICIDGLTALDGNATTVTFGIR